MHFWRFKPASPPDAIPCERLLSAIQTSWEPNMHPVLLETYAHEACLAECGMLHDREKTLYAQDLSSSHLAYSAGCDEESLHDFFHLYHGRLVGGGINDMNLIKKLFYFTKAAFRLDIWMADRIRDLDPDFCKIVHGMVMEGYDRAAPGRFREKMCYSSGGTPYLHPRDIPNTLESLCHLVRKQFPLANTWTSRFSLACYFYVDFLSIHPFNNGNGRTARLLFSCLLRDFTPVPLSFHQTTEWPGEDHRLYIDALRAARLLGTPEPFMEYAAKGLRMNLERIYEKTVFAPEFL